MKISRSELVLSPEALQPKNQRRLRLSGVRIERALVSWQTFNAPEASAFLEDLPEDAEPIAAFAKLVRYVAERVG